MGFENSLNLQKIYPFKSNYITLDGHRLHYLDEGEGDGEPIVMVHGNPTWSFYFRNLVIGLRKKFRIIVPDHIGCGLSDKPQNYEYRLHKHIENLEALINKLDLKNITLVFHDWGGAIGMGWAVRHPEDIKRFIVLNTAAFLLPHLPFRIRICRFPVFGDIAVRGLNLFAGSAIYMACKKKERMTPDVRAGYLAPYNNYANRIAILKFVQDIPMNDKHFSYSLMQKIEENLKQFKDYPMLIIWGEKDFCFNSNFLHRWQYYFPHAKVKKIPDAGHYVVEDAWEEMLPWINDFLEI